MLFQPCARGKNHKAGDARGDESNRQQTMSPSAGDGSILAARHDAKPRAANRPTKLPDTQRQRSRSRTRRARYPPAPIERAQTRGAHRDHQPRPGRGETARRAGRVRALSRQAGQTVEQLLTGRSPGSGSNRARAATRGPGDFGCLPSRYAVASRRYLSLMAGFLAAGILVVFLTGRAAVVPVCTKRRSVRGWAQAG